MVIDDMRETVKLSHDMNAALHDSKRTKHSVLKEFLLGEMTSGKLRSGEPLLPQRELAESLGVAVGTVRQAIHDLEQDGFIRSIQGKGTFVTSEQERCSHKKQSILALIVTQVREGFYPSLLQGFSDGAESVEHQTLICNSGNKAAKQEHVIRQLVDQQIGGVAMVPIATSSSTPVEHVQRLVQADIPVVFCHRAVGGIAAPCVTWSGKEGGRIAARLLLKMGHRRIAGFFVHRYEMAAAELCGLREVLHEAGTDLPDHRVCYYTRSVPEPEAEPVLREALRAMLSLKDRPTAIFTAFDGDAELLYVLARREGLRIPEDLSLITFGGVWRGGELSKRITCVAVDEYEIGRRAAKFLYNMRMGRDQFDSTQRVMMPLALLPGETVGPSPLE